MKLSLYNLGIFYYFAVIIRETLRRFNAVYPIFSSDSSTIIFTLIDYFALIIVVYFISVYGLRNRIDSRVLTLVFLYITSEFVFLIYGLFAAQDYWDYKYIFVTNLPYYFGIVFGYLALIPGLPKKIIKLTVNYIFIFSIALIPFTADVNDELYSRVVFTSTILLFFIPYLGHREKLIIIATCIISTIITPDLRAGMLKYIFGYSILLLFYLRFLASVKACLLIHKIIFIVPIVFIILGSLGIYNIFQPFEFDYFEIDGVDDRKINLLADSRTFVYEEISQELNFANAWIFGKGAGASYASVYTETGGAVAGKRFGSEVGFLNRLLKGGLFGIMVYTLMFYFLSLYAIRESKNQLARLLGLAIASKWAFSFIEEYTLIDGNFLYTYLIMGLISATWFRDMTDNQVRRYLS